MADGRSRVIIALGPPDFERLAAWARAEERGPDQQATWIVRAALQHVQVTEVEGPERGLPSAKAVA